MTKTKKAVFTQPMTTLVTPVIHRKLKALARRNSRSLCGEVRLALDKHLASVKEKV